MDVDQYSEEQLINLYTEEYWQCNECREHEGQKVEIVLGWRNTSSLSFPESVPDTFFREYLIKFTEESYTRARWVPATWLAGVSFALKRNFDAKLQTAIKDSKDVILDDWLQSDIIFDVVYNENNTREKMNFASQKEELNAIANVSNAFCKWKKLAYEEGNSF
jgi:hypothetical protein